MARRFRHKLAPRLWAARTGVGRVTACSTRSRQVWERPAQTGPDSNWTASGATSGPRSVCLRSETLPSHPVLIRVQGLHGGRSWLPLGVRASRPCGGLGGTLSRSLPVRSGRAGGAAPKGPSRLPPLRVCVSGSGSLGGPRALAGAPDKGGVLPGRTRGLTSSLAPRARFPSWRSLKPALPCSRHRGPACAGPSRANPARGCNPDRDPLPRGGPRAALPLFWAQVSVSVPAGLLLLSPGPAPWDLGWAGSGLALRGPVDPGGGQEPYSSSWTAGNGIPKAAVVSRAFQLRLDFVPCFPARAAPRPGWGSPWYPCPVLPDKALGQRARTLSRRDLNPQAALQAGGGSHRAASAHSPLKIALHFLGKNRPNGLCRPGWAAGSGARGMESALE